MFTFAVFVIGHLSSALRDFASGFSSASVRYIFEAIYYLLPNLAHFSYRTESANGMVPAADMLAAATLYAVVYIAILLTFATLIFSRRNFK
jgi:hypothetical protein